MTSATHALNTPTIYDEHELALAAFLWAKGHRLLEVIPDRQRRVHKVFRFAADERIGKDIEDYWNGATVHARDFARCIAELKSLVHRPQSVRSTPRAIAPRL